MNKPQRQTWDLDVFFPGGSDSPEFASFLGQLESDMAGLAGELDCPDTPEERRLAFWWGQLQLLQERVRQAGAFVSCLSAQNLADRGAIRLGSRMDGIQAAYKTVMNRFDAKLEGLPEAKFQDMLSREPWSGASFNLQERRKQAKDKPASALEALMIDLAVDGYHGWRALYNTTVRQMRIPYPSGDREELLSVGQYAGKLREPDRAKRTELFRRWERAWEEREQYCADALNRIAGFRWQMYKHRGWDHPLREPLEQNRMSEATLKAMWDAVLECKGTLVAYLERLARLNGVRKLAWHDLHAPLAGGGESVGYDEAAGKIVAMFGRFSPKLGGFAARAFADGWVEADNRLGKRPGGFCTSFPLSRQSRVFLTYSGGGSLSTLAHELGHAYHQQAMMELPPVSRKYAMNVAETASTLAELIVGDSALAEADTPERKLALLQEKAGRAVTFFMDIHARFLFETRFYEERKSGLLTADRLNELMIAAQEEAFCGALGDYHPRFWASKGHFYNTAVPFYNFPYTFGYLFASGLYAEAQRDKESFEERYAALLRDTGRMTVENLAEKHLGADLTQPEFWREAAGLSVRDIRLFLELTEAEVQSRSIEVN
ncbi:M3 family oligoendopeptidase [Paenibacillus oceani]|uniref:M3 family oligoendopeptidase n=1 Tax=Paenibacillus oceani TaxID=2772510 RepID=A0A927GZN7_9BACL|nr:M3 family oligoendopeptidase [Paenibacillus oceani]MBD2862277.1 M3 family oligoendopeptidase [Paenibacillus oceani]